MHYMILNHSHNDPVDNFGTVVGQNSTSYGILALSMDCQLSTGDDYSKDTARKPLSPAKRID